MPAKNKEYLTWIRNQPCVLTGSTFDVIAHHVTIQANRGFGQKPSDYWSVPLNVTLHARLHHVGERRFWEEYAIDRPHMLAIDLIIRFLKETHPDMSLELLRTLDGFVSEVCGT